MHNEGTEQEEECKLKKATTFLNDMTEKRNLKVSKKKVRRHELTPSRISITQNGIMIKLLSKLNNSQCRENGIQPIWTQQA